MEKSELVSIIMPTYNRSSVIGKSIQSVINQTYTNWELIIIDDSFDDETKILAESFNDERIVYYKNQSKVGAVKARNMGFSFSTGDFITFLDSDCLMCENKIETQINDMINGNYDMVFCGTDMVLQNGKHYFFPEKEDCDFDYKKKLIKGNYIDTSAVMMRRTLFEREKGFDESVTLEDWELFLRIICYGENKVYYEPYYILQNIRQEDSLSNIGIGVAYGYLKIVHKHKDLFDLFRRRGSLKRYIMKAHIASADALFEFLTSCGIDDYSMSDIVELCMELCDEEHNRSIMKQYKVCKYAGIDIGKGIEQFFGDTPNVAIYGLGKNGNILYQELLKLPINIAYGIDNNKKEFNGIPVFALDEALPSVDYIIVSVQNDTKSIIENISNVFKGEIVSIFEVFEEAIDYVVR